MGPELGAIDTAVMQRYHQSMERSGRPAWTRHQLLALGKAAFRVVDAGSSDWIVAPGTAEMTLFAQVARARGTTR